MLSMFYIFCRCMGLSKKLAVQDCIVGAFKRTKTTANKVRGEWIVVTIAGRRLAIAFPDTVLEEHESLRDKTMKIGQIARMCSVYGVDTVEIFRDQRGRGESSLIRHVLEYLETPQYLRRRLFPLDDSLRFAGLLPPLRIPSHRPKVPLSRVSPGELREGVILADGGTVDVGLDFPLALRQRLGGDKRVTVRITSVSPLAGVVVDRSEATEYWGYTVEVRGVEEVITDHRFGMKIATSDSATHSPCASPSFRRNSAALRV